MSGFLPDNYEVPVESNYMSFEDGKNKFRILSSAIVGMEYWKTVDGKRKPIRKRMTERIDMSDVEPDKYGNEGKVKHFWAFVVFNHAANKIQILEITQKTIMNGIRTLIEDKEDWGDPKDYDIIVTKTGKDLETEYSVTPSPKRELSASHIEEYKALSINLDALFSGDDPFEKAMDEKIDVSEIPF